MTENITPVAYVRRPFEVLGLPVTSQNLQSLALWCDGLVIEDETGRAYVHVGVKRPAAERLTRAYPGDWILRSESESRGASFKVYTAKAFENSFVKAANVTFEVDGES